MLSKIAIAVLLGASASATPFGPGQGWSNSQGSGSWGPGSWGGAPEPSTGDECNDGSAGPQQPFKFPLSNGFPTNVNSTALSAIEKQARGTLPNITFPSQISDASATTWQLIAFNEIFEVAFFTSLLNNITTEYPDSEAWNVGSGAARQIILNALTAVQAQEELHAIGANAVLASANRTQIQPCEYTFPSVNFDSAIGLAATFTDLVLGTLQDALNNFGTTGDLGFLPIIGGVIGQEGEQNGFYRLEQGKIPSALPFLTRSAGPLAFSALNQMFVVPGSCGNLNAIGLPIFGALTVETADIKAQDQTLQFSFTKQNATQSTSGLSLAYINQQNVPVVVPLQNVQTSGETVSFSADFPYEEHLLNGLTIAAVTSSAGPFSNADDVASATVFGPGLIEIN